MITADPKITVAQRTLREKAQAPKDQSILSVLRLLKPEIRLMLDAGHRGTAIYRVLSQSWEWSQRGFYEAWSSFLEENDWQDKKQALRPVAPGSVRSSQPTPTAAARPQQIPASYTPPHGSALEAIQRISVTDLLRQAP